VKTNVFCSEIALLLSLYLLLIRGMRTGLVRGARVLHAAVL
jgi:hypothetical protein